MANREKINAVLDKITAENLDMGDWGRKASCGTTMCFAGHAVANEGLELDWRVIDTKWDSEKRDFVPVAWEATRLTDGRLIEDAAREILDLSYGEASDIFYATHIGSDVESLRELVTSVLNDEYDKDEDDD